MKNLLIDEYPMIVLPSLAALVGLEEAVFLQQVHYWTASQGQEINGRRWVYNTRQQWIEQMPWLSERTLSRMISKLKDDGVLLVEQLSDNAMIKTNYYAIDYQALDALITHIQPAELASPACQPGTPEVPTGHYVTETTTETTTENKTLPLADAKAAEQDECREIWREYSRAYMNRYSTEPVRNAKVNAQIRQLRQRLGADARWVAGFYADLNDKFFVERCHDLGLLVSQCEAIRTRWATNMRSSPTARPGADKSFLETHFGHDWSAGLDVGAFREGRL